MNCEIWRSGFWRTLICRHASVTDRSNKNDEYKDTLTLLRSPIQHANGNPICFIQYINIFLRNVERWSQGRRAFLVGARDQASYATGTRSGSEGSSFNFKLGKQQRTTKQPEEYLRIDLFCESPTGQWKLPPVSAEAPFRQTELHNNNESGHLATRVTLRDEAELGCWCSKGGLWEGTLLQLLFDFQRG